MAVPQWNGIAPVKLEVPWVWFWLAVAVFAGPTAALLIKIYNTYGDTYTDWFLLAIIAILHILLIYGFIVVLRNEKVSTMYTLVLGLAIIYAVLFGVFAFGEVLSYTDITGIILIIIGAILLGSKI